MIVCSDIILFCTFVCRSVLISSLKWTQYKTEFVYLTSTLVLPELINWSEKSEEDPSSTFYPLPITFQPDDLWTLFSPLSLLTISYFDSSAKYFNWHRMLSSLLSAPSASPSLFYSSTAVDSKHFLSTRPALPSPRFPAPSDASNSCAACGGSVLLSHRECSTCHRVFCKSCELQRLFRKGRRAFIEETQTSASSKRSAMTAI